MRMSDDPRLCLAFGIFFKHALQNIDTLVGRAVVNKDDIKVMIRLLEDGAGTPLDIFLYAVDRYENTDGVWFLRHSSTLSILKRISLLSNPLVIFDLRQPLIEMSAPSFLFVMSACGIICIPSRMR